MSAGKVIIVTGASRGIGLAVSRLLLQCSPTNRLVAVARSLPALEDIRSRHPDQVQVLAGDFADTEVGRAAVNLAIATWNRLDGLVINHGRMDPVHKIADAQLEQWKECFDINVFSAIAMIQAALPSLRQTKGRIVLTSSGAACKATTAWGCYGASKAILNHLAATLAVEEPEVVTVAIRPGVVDTEMQSQIATVHSSSMDQEDSKRFSDMRNEGKMLRPEQPGNVMARLVLDAPIEISGQFLNWNADKLAMFQDQ